MRNVSGLPEGACLCADLRAVLHAALPSERLQHEAEYTYLAFTNGLQPMFELKNQDGQLG